MAQKDYYAILGVPETASAEEIKKAFRRLAKEHHPDVHSGDPHAEEQFKEISEAYDILSDPKKRKKYDQLRKFRAQGFGQAGPEGIRFEDLFGRGKRRSGGFTYEDLGDLGGLGDLFGDLFDRAGRYQGTHTGPRRGEDLHAEIEIPFETAVQGGKTALSFQRNEQCAVCGGSGAQPGSDVRTCPMCKGRGTVSFSQGGFSVSRPCPQCYGRGTLVSEPCKTCGGTGEVRVPRTLSARIPPGIEDGGKIRLRGQGEPGVEGGPPGDLIITVRVQPHRFFERRGDDIYCEVPVDLVGVALGTKIKVRTIHGGQRAVVSIPPGTQTGTTFRLAGMGLRRNGRRGDQYVRIKVVTPTDLSKRERELLEAFARERKGKSK